MCGQSLDGAHLQGWIGGGKADHLRLHVQPLGAGLDLHLYDIASGNAADLDDNASTAPVRMAANVVFTLFSQVAG
jgi:hypothetical protein